MLCDVGGWEGVWRGENGMGVGRVEVWGSRVVWYFKIFMSLLTLHIVMGFGFNLDAFMQ